MKRDPSPALKYRSRLLFVLTLLAAVSAFLSAQDNLGRGRVTGTVVDDGGAAVEGARIIAESVAGDAKLEGVSDKKGRYAIAGLGSGAWRFTASKDGFTPFTVETEVRQLRANPPVDFTLKRATSVAALKADAESLAIFEKGNALAAEGRYDDAIAVFEEFLAKYPAVYQARLNIASAYLKKDELDKAEAEFKLVLDKIIMTHGDYAKDKGTAVRAYSGLGELYLKKSDFDSGQKAFAEALRISPEDETAAYNVGEILFSNQKNDEAIGYFEMAIRIKKEWPKPYYRLGFVYLNKGDMAKSVEYFNEFIRLDPQNPEVPQVKNIIGTIEGLKK
jgi:tetratricopeptide (TPR) repeat protein